MSYLIKLSFMKQGLFSLKIQQNIEELIGKIR